MKLQRKKRTIDTTFVKLKYIDHGFYALTAAAAKELCGGKLPMLGNEKRVSYLGHWCWVARTQTGGITVWSIRRQDGGPLA